MHDLYTTRRRLSLEIRHHRPLARPTARLPDPGTGQGAGTFIDRAHSEGLSLQSYRPKAFQECLTNGEERLRLARVCEQVAIQGIRQCLTQLGCVLRIRTMVRVPNHAGACHRLILLVESNDGGGL